MKIKFTVVVALLVAVFTFKGYAQDDDNVLIYSSYDDAGKDKVTQTTKFTIKINPLLILSGDLPIYVEKPFSDNFSMELGLGVTHEDFLYNNFGNIDDFQTNEERRANLGYSARIAAKYYPSSYLPAPEGWYGGIEIRYRRYNTQILDNCDNSSFSSTYLDEYRKQIDGRIIFGYSLILGENIVFDLYSGIGMRYSDENQYQCINSGPSQFLTMQTEPPTTAPRLSLGFKFGFAIN